MDKIIALDFDGVICDSVNECMLISYYAFKNKKISKIHIDIDEIKLDLQLKFKKYRYLVGPAKNFYFLWDLIINKKTENLELEFSESLIHRLGEEEKFVEKFYNYRDTIKKNKFDEWAKFNPFYPIMRELLKNNINLNNLYIITAKDLQSTFDLLKYNGISISKNNIYSREISLNKVKLFSDMLKKENFNSGNIIYIEDKISHLIKVKDIGIRGYLATWGYNSDSDKNMAKDNNIPEVSLENISDILLNNGIIN